MDFDALPNIIAHAPPYIRKRIIYESTIVQVATCETIIVCILRSTVQLRMHSSDTNMYSMSEIRGAKHEK